jgi:hypothetical protein
MFNVAHQILAAQYNKISKEVPLMIQHQEVNQIERNKRKTVQKVLFYVNIAVPVANGVI